MVATFQSPGVYSSEVDTTTGVTGVSTSTGAFVGTFNWGPVNEVTQVTSGQNLLTQFGDPDQNTYASFFTAWNFLQYSNDLQVVRALGSGAKNATANGNGTLIENDNWYFQNNYTQTTTNSWTARYPAAVGNSVEVIVFANSVAWTATSQNTADPLYNFANEFPYAPGTSPYVTNATNGAVTNDAMHIVVVDSLGLITGTANTVLERFPNLSRLVDSFSPTGISNYYKEYIYQNSNYIFNTGIPAAAVQGWGITIQQALSTPLTLDAVANVAQLSGGADGTVNSGNTVIGMGLFTDPTSTDIDLFMVGAGAVTETNYIVGVAQQRKDFVVFASPPLANTIDPTGPANSMINYATSLTHSSYLFVDSGWKYQYDQFNNVYRYIPLNGDVAGLCAQTDNTNAPWWSPAGLRRGNVKNVIKLAHNPGSLADRNALYSAAINPVVTFKGQGTILYGDKTFLNYPSVFDHINVRRLFIYLEKIISQAAQSSLFEFNDSFTQTAFVNLVTPVLRAVQAGRGIVNYQVICDGTNNTPDVINANQFVGDIYIVPAQSINYIALHFVAVDNGVDFSTVVGQVQ